MTRLYGFTTILQDQHVIGFGKQCFVCSIYLAKVPKKRLKLCYYMTDASKVVFQMKHNCDKFRFFGYVSIDKKDLMDE